MKLKDILPMDGEMSQYDYDMMRPTKALLEYLRSQPTFKWWNHFYKRLKFLSPNGCTRLSDLSRDFLGWISFTARNPRHPLTVELLKEFRRVCGRDAKIYDV